MPTYAIYVVVETFLPYPLGPVLMRYTDFGNDPDAAQSYYDEHYDDPLVQSIKLIGGDVLNQHP